MPPLPPRELDELIAAHTRNVANLRAAATKYGSAINGPYTGDMSVEQFRAAAYVGWPL